jgi:hypothetical protein
MQLQMLQQRHAQHQQQQRREPSHLLNGSANGIGADAILRQPTANAMATKIYEERLKHPQQRDALDETAMKVLLSTCFLQEISGIRIVLSEFVDVDLACVFL